MAALVATAVKMAGGNDRFDDTITDRMNHVTTSAILVVMATLVTTTNLVGTPIECWIPKEFKKTQVEYINNICWVKGMYNTSFDTEFIPSARGSGRKATIVYYPWVPLILLGMAFMYSFPCIIWRSFQAKSGFDLSNFVDYGFKVSSPKVKNDVRDSLLDHMTSQIERYLGHSRKAQFLNSSSPNSTPYTPYTTKWTISFKHIFTKTCFQYVGHRHLNYFSILQISTKILYVLNAVGLMFLLDVILGVNFHRYGTDIISSILRWNVYQNFNSYDLKRVRMGLGPNNLEKMLSYHQEIRFPKVTLCDFKVRRVAGVINYTVQCALPTNLFNEKIFLILWFWMVLVAMMNTFSLIKWTLRICIGKDRYNYVKNLLLLSGLISPKSKSAQKRRLSIGDDSTSNVSGISEININNNNNINNKHEATKPHNGLSHLSNSKRPLERLINQNHGDNTSMISSILTTQQLNERKLLLKFVTEHLGMDGVLLLHILNQATNTIVAMEMVEKLWINFRERYEYVLQQQEDDLQRKYTGQQRVQRV